MNKINILKKLFLALNNKEECKNNECKNKRRHCSCYCEECSEKLWETKHNG